MWYNEQNSRHGGKGGRGVEKRSSYGSGLSGGAEEFVSYPARSTTNAWYGCEPDHYSRHWHGDVEIIEVLRGSVRATVGEQRYRLQAGELLLIPSGQPHSMSTRPESARYVYQFQLFPVMGVRGFGALRPLLLTPVLLTPEMPVTSQVRALLAEAVKEAGDRSALSDLRIYGIILQLYAVLGDAWERGEVDGSVPQRHTANQAVMDDAAGYIGRHYMEQLSLEQMAARTGLSPCYFSRLFRRYTGVTFLHFVEQKRLAAACHLLAYTDLPVAQVCVQAGFLSQATFSRNFREEMRVTPTAYRRASRMPSAQFNAWVQETAGTPADGACGNDSEK